MVAKVKVKSFSVIRDVLGAEVVEIGVKEPATVCGLFDELVRQHGQSFKDKIWDPNTGQIAPFLIRLNESMIRSTNDMAHEIKNGDELAIIFPIGGG
jgi:MoaD family protein